MLIVYMVIVIHHLIILFAFINYDLNYIQTLGNESLNLKKLSSMQLSFFLPPPVINKQPTNNQHHRKYSEYEFISY